MPSPKTKTKTLCGAARTRALRIDISANGLSIAEAARKHNVSNRYLYELVAKYKLPTNPSILPNSKLEGQIIRALVICGLRIENVARLYGQSPVNIRRLIQRIKTSTP